MARVDSAGTLGAPRAAAAAILAYLVGVALAYLAGFRMIVPEWYFQFLPAELLRDRLAESLWNLHAQPPLLDLLLGIALKAERALRVPAADTLLAVQITLGAAAIAAFADLLSRMGVASWARWALLAVGLANPVLYHYIFLFFQPAYEFAFLLLAAWTLFVLMDRPALRLATVFCSILLLLAYTRSLFHFVFILGALTLTCLALERRAALVPHERRARRVLFGAAAVLVLAWPAKNAARFGVFSYSSWQGFNLSRDLGIPEPEALRAFADGAPPDAAADRLAEALVPRRFASIPSLVNLRKANGSPNWNHYAIVPLSQQLGRDAWARIRSEPRLLARKAWTTLADRYALNPGRQPYSGELVGAARSPAAEAWMETFEYATLQTPPGSPSHGISAPRFFTFLLLAGTLYAVLRALRSSMLTPRGAVQQFATVAVVWVLAMSALVDGAEANRMRFATDPLLALAIFVPLRRQD